MTDPPLVSVVIPVMDRATELRRCLASLRRISYPASKLEVIVVDDGSRDDSAAVAEELGATVVSSGGRGQGPAVARNRGAAVARGELLAFIDSDCTASPGWLADLVDRFRDPDPPACTTARRSRGRCQFPLSPTGGGPVPAFDPEPGRAFPWGAPVGRQPA